MKSTEIKTGKTYEVTAGRNKTKVKVAKFNPKTGSWECETESGKTISIKDSKRFLVEIGGKKTPKPQTDEPAQVKTKKANAAIIEAETTADEKPKRTREPRADGTVSGLEAAIIVLRDAGQPLNIKQIMERINERGLAKLAGKTPDATVSAAIQRELVKKGDESRFEKAGKGLFSAR